MPQENDTTTQRANKGGTPSLRRVLATAAALPRAVLSLRTLFTKKEDRPLPQRTLLAAAICLPLAAICLSTVTENAFFILGEERGRGMDKAYAALRCRLSAGLGDVEAQVRLAKLYAEGHGLPRDEEKSLFWYGEAARQGHAGAQRYLAFEAYSLTWAEMARWRQKLADQGDVRAKYLLGDMYAKGIGVRRTKPKPFTGSAVRRTRSMTVRSSCWATCMPQATACRRIRPWQQNGSARRRNRDMARLGSGWAACMPKATACRRTRPKPPAGTARRRCEGMTRRPSSSAACMPQATACRRTRPKRPAGTARAAEQKNVRAQWRLGNMYASGDGVPQDKAEAAHWFPQHGEIRERRGAVADQQYICLGRRSAKGHGKGAGLVRYGGRAWGGPGAPAYFDVRRVEKEAGRSGRLAPQAGGTGGLPSRSTAWASSIPGARDCCGTGPRRPAGSARRRNRDMPRAQWHLGNMLDTGEGVPQDRTEAAAWFRKAAEQGIVRRSGGSAICMLQAREWPQDKGRSGRLAP